ncbi:hypothetical protein IX307_000599 [Bacteroides pyogenes]|uniref:lipopolysaccharide biosynthesis protein n=1 Tax=Bacteroides pyogenes TaxID=310300 RepID=UPI001BA7E3CB|nr:hypothetical protein [Bacteroides pyogenes]MBR8719419.1 hypothetical protein [Bacteroides pyogenes]MBR8786296.1 hypothetical protein [Bacteroides pyogenes]MBR8791779.1 hypothetical protein [Bacteroides pyogenes]
MKSSIRSNILLSIVAQIISLSASFLLGLIVPKYVEIDQYAYWQTFILYTGYVGILHFGLLDGIVLRYSQYDYDELNKPMIRAQLGWLTLFTTVSALICYASSLFISDTSSRIVCILVGINIIVINFFYYSTYVHQITNEIPKYVSIVIVERLTHVLLTVLLLLFGAQEFYWFCIVQILGSCFGIFLAMKKSKEVFFGTLQDIASSIKELKLNISAGIQLLAANWSAMFLVGGAKTFIQWHWDLKTFGYISFSFSLTSLFLSFITAVSVVFFPALKRSSAEKLNTLYPQLRLQMTALLLVLLAMYYPIEYLLPLWLPKYTYSLKYFGIILPIVIFTSRLSLLINNYLKVFRQEGAMFKINVSTLVMAIIGYIPCTYLFDNLEMVIYWAVFVIILRSILSEIHLTKLINTSFKKETIFELFVCLVFMASLYVHNKVIGVSIYLISVGIYFMYIFSSPKRCHMLLKIKGL